MNEELVLRAVLALESFANPGLRWGDIIALSVGLVQCSLIFWGLRLMRAGNDDRQRQADLAEKRHEENMLALRTLIERTASQN